MKKFFSIILAVLIAGTPEMAQAQTMGQVLNLPQPGTMVRPSEAFHPVVLRGMIVHPDNPMQMDFIVDSGDKAVDTATLKAEGQKLVNYFLAAMTVPRADLWVNLSPVEKDRIMPDELVRTELGREFLAQDYLLKQLAASLLYPEDSLGKEFWKRVYSQAQEKFGTTDIPVDTFNKVWIVPEKASVYEKGNTVYVTGLHLKVMLEADYLVAQKAQDTSHQTQEGTCVGALCPVTGASEAQDLAKQVLREVIIPVIEKDVNEGRNFASLRQAMYSLVLAQWYQDVLKDSILNKAYTGKNKVAGIDLNDPASREQIYARYMEAYKKGVFNYIKEDDSSDVIPRKYFSGGVIGSKAKREPATPTELAMAGQNTQNIMSVQLDNVASARVLDPAATDLLVEAMVKKLEKDLAARDRLYHALVKGDHDAFQAFRQDLINMAGLQLPDYDAREILRQVRVALGDDRVMLGRASFPASEVVRSLNKMSEDLLGKSEAEVKRRLKREPNLEKDLVVEFRNVVDQGTFGEVLNHSVRGMNKIEGTRGVKVEQKKIGDEIIYRVTLDARMGDWIKNSVAGRWDSVADKVREELRRLIRESSDVIAQEKRWLRNSLVSLRDTQAVSEEARVREMTVKAQTESRLRNLAKTIYKVALRRKELEQIEDPRYGANGYLRRRDMGKYVPDSQAIYEAIQSPEIALPEGVKAGEMIPDKPTGTQVSLSVGSVAGTRGSLSMGMNPALPSVWEIRRLILAGWVLANGDPEQLGGDMEGLLKKVEESFEGTELNSSGMFDHRGKAFEALVQEAKLMERTSLLVRVISLGPDYASLSDGRQKVFEEILGNESIAQLFSDLFKKYPRLIIPFLENLQWRSPHSSKTTIKDLEMKEAVAWLGSIRILRLLVDHDWFVAEMLGGDPRLQEVFRHAVIHLKEMEALTEGLAGVVNKQSNLDFGLEEAIKKNIPVAEEAGNLLKVMREKMFFKVFEEQDTSGVWWGALPVEKAQVQGGIDARNMGVTRHGELIQNVVNGAALEQMIVGAPGLKGMIMDIHPVMNLMMLLGLKADGTLSPS